MTRRIAGAAASRLGRFRDLVRQATLAASSHNTQPWTFALDEQSITILPDFTRRTPIVDPDDHHLFVSLGCATENLVHAALASGLHADVRIQDNAIAVAFVDTTPVRSPLFESIPNRQCSRSIYDGHPLAANELRALAEAAHRDGVHAIVLTAAPEIETVLEYVTRANAIQIGDPAFVAELKAWRTDGDGIPYAAVGASMISTIGRMPSATLAGNYRFLSIGAPINESDTVTVRDARDAHTVAGVLGGGVKYYVSPRWGIRLDARVSLSKNPARTTLDATPNVVMGGLPAGRFLFLAPTTIMFSNSTLPVTNQGVTVVGSSTLTGPALTGVRTFSGSGVSSHTNLAAGVFWRF